MEGRKPVTELSNRQLLEESAEILRTLRDTLTELEPLLAMARGMGGNGGPAGYVQAAGMRRAAKRGRNDANRQ